MKKMKERFKLTAEKAEKIFNFFFFIFSFIDLIIFFLCVTFRISPIITFCALMPALGMIMIVLIIILKMLNSNRD